MNYRIGDAVTLPGGLHYTLGEDAFAVMLDREEGAVMDVALNVDTAESMVLDGYLADVLDHQAGRWAATFDALERSYEDCWGVPRPLSHGETVTR